MPRWSASMPRTKWLWLHADPGAFAVCHPVTAIRRSHQRQATGTSSRTNSVAEDHTADHTQGHDPNQDETSTSGRTNLVLESNELIPTEHFVSPGEQLVGVVYGLPTSSVGRGHDIVEQASGDDDASRCSSTIPCSRAHWHCKNKDGTLVSRTLTTLGRQRSVRHAHIILRRPREFIVSVAAPSRLVACPVGCRPGLFKELGGEMAQALSGRTGCRRAIRTRLARPLASTQNPIYHDTSAGG
jgi:hypothetical protein